MTRRGTDLIASEYIMKPDFPSGLPNFFLLTFNNHGHYYLFDYARFLMIIYQTVEKYKKISASFKMSQWPTWVAIGITMAIATIYVMKVREVDVVELVACGLPGLLLFILLQPRMSKKVKKGLI